MHRSLTMITHLMLKLRKSMAIFVLDH